MSSVRIWRAWLVSRVVYAESFLVHCCQQLVEKLLDLD